jgi:hypothetical protein
MTIKVMRWPHKGGGGCQNEKKGNYGHHHPSSLHGLASRSRSGFIEGGHQLEKLEFALAIAEARGDQIRCSTLRDRIADLGGNAEEPGT